MSTTQALNPAMGSALPYRPVAVFVGGTAGIGAAMAKAFATHRNGDAHIVIVGRNRQAAEELIASLPKPADGQTPHEFVECDASLMRNVRQTTAELVRKLPKINFLVLSAGFLTTQGRNETDEGIDKRLALHYYSRWRFTYDLIPLLQKAVDANEDAKVMTVLNSTGQSESDIDLDNLGLKKNYSPVAAAKYGCACSNAMIESFAEKHPKMSFVHVFPGLVRTQLLDGNDDWKLRLLSPLTHLLAWVVGVSPEACAEYMWHGLYASKAGWSRRDSHGEEINGKPRPSEVRSKVWDHSLEVTGGN
ncbi:NAD(P)-binding protein [Irpex lacteus]|nr:NAD(P)-binding protein [Irpex lacteus]